jgi:hypothetical protein
VRSLAGSALLGQRTVGPEASGGWRKGVELVGPTSPRQVGELKRVRGEVVDTVVPPPRKALAVYSPKLDPRGPNAHTLHRLLNGYWQEDVELEASREGGARFLRPNTLARALTVTDRVQRLCPPFFFLDQARRQSGRASCGSAPALTPTPSSRRAPTCVCLTSAVVSDLRARLPKTLDEQSAKSVAYDPATFTNLLEKAVVTALFAGYNQFSPGQRCLRA